LHPLHPFPVLFGVRRAAPHVPPRQLLGSWRAVHPAFPPSPWSLSKRRVPSDFGPVFFGSQWSSWFGILFCVREMLDLSVLSVGVVLWCGRVPARRSGRAPPNEAISTNDGPAQLAFSPARPFPFTFQETFSFLWLLGVSRLFQSWKVENKDIHRIYKVLQFASARNPSPCSRLTGSPWISKPFVFFVSVSTRVLSAQPYPPLVTLEAPLSHPP